MRFSLITLMIMILGYSYSYAQVSIAPTNLFLDDRSGFGSYMVINNSNENQEISVSFNFSYSQSDSDGKRFIVRDDSLMAQKHSIADKIRAFPQNFVLPPNQRQVVRLRISGTQELSDGTYWSRIHTVSNKQSAPVEVSSEDQVRASLGIKFEQITGVFFKKGEVSTGIEVKNVRTNISNNQLNVLTDYKKIGNSPFLGSITVSLIDENGNTILENFTSTSLYLDGTHKQVLDIDEINSGQYRVNVRFESKRSDISSDDLIQLDSPVSATNSITIP